MQRVSQLYLGTMNLALFEFHLQQVRLYRQTRIHSGIDYSMQSIQ